MITRRTFCLGFAAAYVGCSRKEKTTREPAASPSPTNATSRGASSETALGGSVRMVEWDFDGSRGGITRAAVLVPTWGAPGAKYPVLIALHGRGEAVKPPALGALGWPKDYLLTRAFDRLRAPPLTDADYEGFSDPDRMARANASLAERPFGGMIVACPHVPDLPEGPNGGGVTAIAQFMTDVLLPRVRAETPALASAEATGIDGVSMGGALALRVGLANAHVFGAVGSLQAAIGEDNAGELAEMARAARARRPELKLRLLTSKGDYFREAILRTSAIWNEAGVTHDFADVPGPHDYAFNRGPGAIEMLLWHDRSLSHG